MKGLVLASVFVVLFVAPSFPQEKGSRFVSIVLHDVVDQRQALDSDAVTTERLISLFEFLRGNGCTAISLDDIEQSVKLNRPLPNRAVLLTFDDGLRSHYTRVFPLLLAYRMPAVMGLVGSWMMGLENSRGQYLSWDEAREMQRSGLVEFASHTYDLHRGTAGNPQGSQLPATGFRRYDPSSGYEDEGRYRLRIRQDLETSIAVMKRELGRPPRAVVWPYGRYTSEDIDLAREAGFTFALTLDSEPADTSRLMAIPRYLVAENFDFQKITNDLRSIDVLPSAQRLVEVDPSNFWSGGERDIDARLGRAIERVKTLGATSVVIDAAASCADGTLCATWFPNSYLPVRSDVFSRFAWQMRTRAGVTVFGKLPVKAALATLEDPERVLDLFRQFGLAAPLDGLLLEDAAQLTALRSPITRNSATPWEVRTRRDAIEYTTLTALDALALRCFRIVEAARPRLSLALLTDTQTLTGPSSIADLTLIPTSANPKDAVRLVEQIKKLGWSQSFFPRNFGVWIDEPKPPTSSGLVAVVRTFQRNGFAVIGWADDMSGDRPPAARITGSVSGSSFPVRF